jgi:hypothetical protein
LRTDPGGGADHIVKGGQSFGEILENLHVLHDVDGCPCGHPEYSGQVAALGFDQDQAPDSHVVHGPGHGPDVFRDLRLYKNNGNMVKVKSRHHSEFPRKVRMAPRAAEVFGRDQISKADELNEYRMSNKVYPPSAAPEATREFRMMKFDALVKSRHPGSRLSPGQGHRGPDIL